MGSGPLAGSVGRVPSESQLQGRSAPVKTPGRHPYRYWSSTATPTRCCRWTRQASGSHLVTCINGHQTIAGFGVHLRDPCNPATWQDRYTAQMLHVWVVPYPGGVFSDDLSAAATSAAVQAVLAQRA